MRSDAQSLGPIAGFWGGRLLIFFALIFASMSTLAAGVEFSVAGPTSDLLTRLYFTLGLFVFGGLDLGVPSGGPDWARTLLWCVFFLAPAITTSALLEGILLLVRPNVWRRRWLRRHVIVGGCGRLALLYVDKLRERHPDWPIVLVDLQADNPSMRLYSTRPRTHVVVGNIGSEALLKSLALERARGVVLMTGDDYANLEAASHVDRLVPALSPHTLVHVSDIRLLRVLEDTEILEDAVKFNSYRTAAQHLVESTLVPHFEADARLDTVVLAGFGRFGQTVLDELQHRAMGLFKMVVVVDLEAELLSLVFDEQVGFRNDYQHQVIEADLRHPETWREIGQYVEVPGPQPVFILGSGLDGVNIRTALGLSKTFPEARIVARCFDGSMFTEQISEQCGFEIVSTAQLLLDSLQPAERDNAGLWP